MPDMTVSDILPLSVNLNVCGIKGYKITIYSTQARYQKHNSWKPC